MNELLPNTDLLHYRIVSKIGAGGMGEVFLAEDSKLDRQVALKVLLTDVADDDERVRRFQQEAKAASALNHPNILTVFEIGSVEDSHYIATEYINGRTLREIMQDGPIKLRDAFHIILQVTAALGAAHDAGIIHRDIKPENVMLREDGLVKVLDFGLAKLTTASPSTVNTTLPLIITQPGMLVGTVAYMSPEQARGHELDPRSDVFSLGIMMFELFTGRRPFDGESHLDLISSILKDEPPPLRRIAPELPRELEHIVEKTLRKDRKQRYQHIRDVQIDIEDLRNQLDFDDKVSRSSETIVMDLSRAKGHDRVRTGVIKPTLTESISIRRFTLAHALLFALAAIVLAGGVWYFVPSMSATPPQGSYKTTEVATWNSAAGELFSTASFSPDGKMIAFSSTKSGTKNIWVTQTGSTEAIQITDDEFANTDPIYSPKGDEIAYFSDRIGSGQSGNSTSGIWRVGALGGVPRMIAPLTDGNIELRRWSATGKVYYENAKDLYSLDIATGTTQKISNLGQLKVFRIEITPDERSIVWAFNDNDHWKIVSQSLEDRKEVELASGTGKVDGFAWLPDKGRLFYTASVNGVLQVFMSDLTGAPSQITTSETDSSLVDAAADGRSILTSSAKEESNLWRAAISDGTETPIARDLNAKLWPSVSPNGQSIAFQSIKNLSEGNNLFTGAIAVKNLRQIDAGDRQVLVTPSGFLPEWSPDGSIIAFIKQTGNTGNLFTVNPSGGGEKQLTTEGVLGIGYSVSPYNTNAGNSFAFSPNGESVAYLSGQAGASNLWMVGLRDGTQRQITKNTNAKASYTTPVWSDDGKRVALSLNTIDNAGQTSRALITVDVSGSEEAVIHTTPKRHRLIGWSADDRGLIIAEPSKFSSLPPETAIKRITIEGGAESTIANLKNVYFYNMFLSADRKTIAYAARNDDRDDLWIMPSVGGSARKVTSNNDSAIYYSRLAWFNDGSSLAYGKQTRYSLLSMIADID